MLKPGPNLSEKRQKIRRGTVCVHVCVCVCVCVHALKLYSEVDEGEFHNFELGIKVQDLLGTLEAQECLETPVFCTGQS